MAKLSVYLPPFAPDYSGVCSALFDLNALVVIHDAMGCTGNYTGFDEPRWFGSKKAIYCSGLREMDAVLGNESKFIQRITDAANEVHPEFAAFVGSPVPMVMGTDFEGFARELEQQIGIPSFGFATNGTAYYNEGIYLAGRALIERFASHGAAPKPKSVNILGATPLDISESDLRSLAELLNIHGYTVNASFFMGLTLEQIKNPVASANIAVSQAGVRLAEYMRKEFGIPYIIGLPFGEKNAEDYIKSLSDAENSDGCIVHMAEDSGTPNTLIIGDEVWANSLKNAMVRDFGASGIDVGAIFGKHGGIYPDSLDLSDEKAIIGAVNSGRYDLVIADPLICDLIVDEKVKRVSVPHYAISSKIHANPNISLMAGNANTTIGKELKNV